MNVLLAALAACLFVASAHAQSTPYPSREPASVDFAQLPLAIKVDYSTPAGWQGRTSYWAYAIWSRNVSGSGSGAWYRAVTDAVVLSLSKERVFPRPYTCLVTVGVIGAFDCTDTFGEPRRIQCPLSLRGAPEPLEWRSEEVTGDPNRGWFAWTWENGSDLRWKAWSEFHIVALKSASVSDDKQRLTCNYPVTKRVGGSVDQADTWLMWR